MKIQSLTTPIVLIFFNRPQYVAEVFEIIKKAKPARLFLIADGERNDKDREKLAESKAIVERIDWPCTVLKNYSDINLGSRDRIAGGLDWVFEHTETAIILEDDCLPDQTFFGFCQTLLEKYKDDERVMMISGDNPLLVTPFETTYDFSLFFGIWGWATWRRAWKRYDGTMTEWPRLKKEGWLKTIFDHRQFRNYLTDIFDQTYHENLNSWATRWNYTCLRAGGLAIVPRVNLVSNIGVDGVHSSPGINNNVPLKSIEVSDMKEPAEVRPNAHYDRLYFDRSFPFDPWAIVKEKFWKFLVFGKNIFRKLGLVK